MHLRKVCTDVPIKTGLPEVWANVIQRASQAFSVVG